jgi:hypothetical protein
MKLNLPILLGAAVVAAGLVALLLWKPAPQAQELAAPSLARLRADMTAKGKVEGRDYVIDPPVLLRQDDEEMLVRIDAKLDTGELFREYHRLTTGDHGWQFDQDLGITFRDFAEREKKTACDRLGAELTSRYNANVDIPAANVRIGHRLQEGRDDATGQVRIVGYIDIMFVDKGAESRYVESFTLQKGKWVMEGQRGKLFDRGPAVR